MKALLVSRTFYPEGFGGGEISALHIAKAISKTDNDVVVCCLSEKIEKPVIEKIDNVKIYRFPWKKLKLSKKLSNLEYVYLQIYGAMKKVIKTEKPDVIHFLNFQSIFPVALFFNKYPKFATINSPLFCEFGGSHNGVKSCYNCTQKERFVLSLKKWGSIGLIYWLYNRYAQFVLKLSIKKCTKVFPVSKAIRKMLRSKGIKENKIKVIHNPIEINKEIKTKLKERLNIPRNKKVILYCGRLSKDKGIHSTIKAIKDIKDIIFIVVGKKRSYYNNLKKLVEELNIEEKVKFVGFVDNKEISKFYSIADLVVHPCFYYEPLSRMLLEAASYQIPMVASDIGGNSEIIEDGVNGFLVKNTNELKNKIEEITNNQKLAKKMGEKSKEKIKKEFSYEKITKDLIEEYIV